VPKRAPCIEVTGKVSRGFCYDAADTLPRDQPLFHMLPCIYPVPSSQLTISVMALLIDSWATYPDAKMTYRPNGKVFSAPQEAGEIHVGS
jgi:hypothetical protein